MKKVGIIGGSGFIGSYITQQFLNGGYEVKVSATNISKKEKYQHLMNLNNADNLSISELNVENKKQLKDFVIDCDIVIHGGTPFQLDVQDPQKELLDPTIKGTEIFLDVIKETSGIKKVVFIASVAAYNTNFPLPAGGKTTNTTCSEKDTPFMSDEGHPYAQAKFIAQRTVEKFISVNTDLDFEITTLSPVAVMGKSLSNREDSTSTGLQFLFKNKLAPNPFIQMFYDQDVVFAMVDVKDVAKATFKAATILGLHGENYLLTSESYPVSDITRMLNYEKPLTNACVIYQNKKATQHLTISFQPVYVPLQDFST